MTKIFITGATGYVGGSVLKAIASKHPKYTINALVRDGEKAAAITKTFPHVNTVIGDLDNEVVIKEQTAASDIILHLASRSHIKSVQTIGETLSQSAKDKTVYWIQISGASLLAGDEIANKKFGEPSEKVWDDYDGTEELRSLIRRFPSRDVDNFVLDISTKTSSVKTALVFPPIIYGKGSGPGNQRSVQIPELARVTLQRGWGVQIGKGLSRWGSVHVDDIASLFLGLVEKAAGGKDINAPIWNEDGLYLTGVGETSFGELSKAVAEAAHEQGFIGDKSVEQIDAKEADSLSPHASVLWGTNARSRARRGKQLLGWTPSGPTLENDIPQTVALEAKKLNLKPKT